MSSTTSTTGIKAPLTAAPIDAASTIALLTRPNRAEADLVENALLVRAEQLAAVSAGRRLAAWAWGQRGPKVLLVHGWDSRASHLGSFVEPLLASGCQVVAFDAPAHGDSEGDSANVVAIGQAVLDVANQLGPIEAVIAHSVGSPACLYAFAHGLRVRASVHLAGPSSLQRVLQRFAAMCRLPDDQLPLLHRLMAERIGASLDVMELDSLIAGLRHPALMLHDPNDSEVPFFESETLHAAWRQSELRSVDGVGHRRIVRDGAVIESSVRFITQQLPLGAS